MAEENTKSTVPKDEKTENRQENKLEDRLENRTGSRPEDKTGSRPENRPENRPVNNRVLREEAHKEEEEDFDPLRAANENRELMSAACKGKLDVLLKHIGGEEKFDLIFEPVEDFAMQLMVMPGSVRFEENGQSEYRSSMYLPGAIYIKSTKDKNVKMRMPVRQAVALAHFLPQFLKRHPQYVEYLAALEQDIEQRRADLDVFRLGE